QIRIIAKALVANINQSASRNLFERAILASIDQLANWGNRLYEGAPISAAIGLRHVDAKDEKITIGDFSSQDFSAVLSNGHDTIITFNYNQEFINHEQLTLTKP